MRSICLCLAILIGSVVTAYAQIINTPAVGGQGGGPLDDPCHPGDVMVGYNIQPGKALNTFAAVCQAQKNGVLIGANYGLHTWGRDPEGTGGGPFPPFTEIDTPRCPAGQAIFGLTIWVNKFNEVDSVAATCVPLLPNSGTASQIPRSRTNGGQAVTEGAIGCGLGGIAVGITGRSGALIDSLGLKCSPFAWHVAAAPPAPQPPPPVPQPQFVVVKMPDDYFDRPAPPDDDPPKGTLAAGTAGVTVVKKGAPEYPGWYQINWPGAPPPPGENWIFTGLGCDCLIIPPQWQ